jgi:hypothetical protein
MHQQNPVTVSKGEHIVKDVYLSDLEAWRLEGYEIYNPSLAIAKQPEPIAPKKKATKSTSVEPE